jgi:hypothetical protein
MIGTFESQEAADVEADLKLFDSQPRTPWGATPARHSL